MWLKTFSYFVLGFMGEEVSQGAVCIDHIYLIIPSSSTERLQEWARLMTRLMLMFMSAWLGLWLVVTLHVA